ncbi:ATP-binding cassette domain-containing protein [Mangrovicella endophytica]|uniref:ATP-binding cassette domain-containing protein n=1 Tax=Mangrovicella endophytica TaxID=2066697 RepID=UPI000C9DE446|nr:ATP-binding cassette domain-containing protein [Mangrovicella endophytica]
MIKGLALEQVRIGLGGRALVAIDRVVAPGDVLTVMGPSGSGKSSLLAFVGGFLDPSFAVEGRVCLDGTDVTALAPEMRRIGLLFQDALLFPHLSVGGNLAFGLAPSIRGRAARAAAVTAMLEEIDLTGFEARDPATLSGGQQARVALGRTLLSAPRALLLDEPFSRFDMSLKETMRRFVFGLIQSRAIPTLLVTHDPADAQAAGGDVVSLGDAA